MSCLEKGKQFGEGKAVWSRESSLRQGGAVYSGDEQFGANRSSLEQGAVWSRNCLEQGEAVRGKVFGAGKSGLEQRIRLEQVGRLEQGEAVRVRNELFGAGRSGLGQKLDQEVAVWSMEGLFGTERGC